MKKILLIAMLMVCSALMATLPNRPGDREAMEQRRLTITIAYQPIERLVEGKRVSGGAYLEYSWLGNVYYKSDTAEREKPTIESVSLGDLFVFNHPDFLAKDAGHILEDRIRTVLASRRLITEVLEKPAIVEEIENKLDI